MNGITRTCRRKAYLRRIVRLCAAMAVISLAALATPVAAEPGSEAINASLPASGCNRALSLHVLEAEFVDTWGTQEPPPGRRWLALELRFDNWMPMDLVFGLDYQEAALVASLERQLYLLVDDRLVLRAQPAAEELEDGFILSGVGSQRQGRVAFAVPEAALGSLSLRYYHDQYAPIQVSWLGEGEPAEATRAASSGEEGHDLMSVGVHDVSLHQSWHGIAAAEDMQWLVVDLRGQGAWQTSVDARALDAQAPLAEKTRLDRVMEYVQAPGLLQAVVDDRYGYVRDTRLSTLAVIPAWLPDAWAGGEAVFAIPQEAERIELVAYMPQFGGTGISTDIRPALRFSLLDGERLPYTEQAVARVDDTPTPLSIHAVQRLSEFAGHRAGEGETLLLVEASMTNLSATGGMMPVSQRLRPLEPAGELLGAYQRGVSALMEPFWLPANDEPRHFELLYRYTGDADTFEFEYGGVSVNTSLTLSP